MAYIYNEEKHAPFELPEMKPLSEREQAIELIALGNSGRIIEKFHYENNGIVSCYVKFKDDPMLVDFSDEFTMAFGDCVLGNYRVVK